MNEINWYNCIGKSKKHKGNLWMIAVVPRAGTWIETRYTCRCLFSRFQSFPVRERGLKPFLSNSLDRAFIVVPRAGTWIETIVPVTLYRVIIRRSPCGNVD